MIRGCKLGIVSSVTVIGNHAFSGCSSLTNITIPNNVKSIGRYTFYGCRSLTSIEISDSVTNIGDRAFESCVKLQSISISSNVTYIGSSVFLYSGITDIYFDGTMEMWKSKCFNGINSAITIHCSDGDIQTDNQIQ